MNETLSIFHEFILFLRQPRRLIEERISESGIIWKITILYISVLFAGLILISPLAMWVGVEDVPNKIEEIFELFPKWGIFLIAVILAPVLEEYIFRFPLKYRRPSIILLCAVFWIIIYFALKLFVPDFQVTNWLVVGFFLSVCTIYMWFKTEISLNNLGLWIDQNYYLILYASAFLFAAAHISNYDFSGNNYLMIPILVFPQFLMAIVFAFVRLKYGMWSNIYLHALNNLFPVMVLLFYPEFGN